MEVLIDLWENIQKGLLEPLFYFTDPKKRINYYYLITSLLLAYYVFKKSRVTLPFYAYIFNKKIWLSKSAFVDYKFFFFNGIIKIVFLLPIINLWRYLSVDINDWIEETFNQSSVYLSENEIVIYYSLTFIILYDLIIYLVHFTMHKVPFLWEFHKVHHSATSLNPITQYRIHPVELVINNCVYILVSSFLVGFFDYFYVGSVKMVVYAEVNIFTMLFLFFGANLRHSHIRLKYFHFLERFIISPFQHQIHHSNNPKHINKNMGSKLAIWDWLFGTLIRSKETKKIRFGIGKNESLVYSSFYNSLFIPFKNSLFSFIKKKDAKN